MASVLSLGAAVWSAITAVAATVASVVATVATAIGSILATMGIALWSGTVGVVTGLLNGIGVISTVQGVHVLSTLSALNSIGGAVFMTVSEAVMSVVAGFKVFLTTIHFHTILAVHNIAYLVSKDYRVMMNKIYGSLGEFSSAIGLGAQFITLAIRNARNVVLDVSNMIGRGYDLGEVEWLNGMNSFFSKINEFSQDIANDPYLILDMIDQNLIKPASDLKGSIMQGVFTTIDTILDFSNHTILDISKLTSDLETLVNDLPNSIRTVVQPLLDKVLEPVDTFIDDVYTPAFARISTAVEILGTRLNVNKDAINDVVSKLKMPGDLLESVSQLPFTLRSVQQNKMFTAVNQPLLEVEEAVNAEYNEEYKRLDAIESAIETEVTKTPYEVSEVEPLTLKDLGDTDKSQTWYVGDY